METNISYYQRLLAMDQAEAAEIVEEQLKTHSQEQLFDEVLIPALGHARPRLRISGVVKSRSPMRRREMTRMRDGSPAMIVRGT